MDGNNSKRTLKILNDPTMLRVYINYIEAEEKDKENYKFTEDQDGYLSIRYESTVEVSYKPLYNLMGDILESRFPNYRKMDWFIPISVCMEEYALQVGTRFLTWVAEKQRSQFRETKLWNNPTTKNFDLTTEDLYHMFQREGGNIV